MPVTTRNQFVQHQTKSIAPPTIIVNTNEQILDQSNSIAVLAPNKKTTGTMNIDRSDLEEPFGASVFDSFYHESDTNKLIGHYGQTIIGHDTENIYDEVSREKALAKLADNQEQIKRVLFGEQQPCMLVPYSPMSECELLSPAARSRSSSAAEAFVPSPCGTTQFDVSAPDTPNQEAPLDILDGILDMQECEFVGSVSALSPVDYVDSYVKTTEPVNYFGIDDILDFIESQPEAPDMSFVKSQPETLDMSFVVSQPEAPREMYTQEKVAWVAAACEQDNIIAEAANSTIFQNLPHPESPIPSDVIDAILSCTNFSSPIDEFENSMSCASPAHSVVSSFSNTNLTASPAHSATSDEDYVPTAVLKRKHGIGGNKRGRKRKAETEFGEETAEVKKLKNAAAAARYREKKKAEEDKAQIELGKVEAQHKDLVAKFNAALMKRNLFLDCLFEENKKNPKFQLPSWVASYLKKE